jgi:chromosome segregation ATPase
VDNSYLYENEAGIEGDFNVLPESGRYPVAPSPEGTTRLPNVIPTVIQKAQATYSVEKDGREVTVDEVARNAAFHRQLNANKAVANLLAIIQQLTANVNAAKADIVLLERKLVDAEVASEECNGEVFSITNTRTKIENAIKARKDKIGEAEARIAELRAVIIELTRKRDALVGERTIIENEKSPNAAKLAALE